MPLVLLSSYPPKQPFQHVVKFSVTTMGSSNSHETYHHLDGFLSILAKYYLGPILIDTRTVYPSCQVI
jgi:hypothetical protein